MIVVGAGNILVVLSWIVFVLVKEEVVPRVPPRLRLYLHLMKDAPHPASHEIVKD